MQEMTFNNQSGQSSLVWNIRRHCHLWTLFRYMTIKKAANLLALAAELLLKRSFLSSHPFFIRVEVSPYCNLRCPGCPLGGADRAESNPMHRKEKMMSLELFEQSVKDLLPYLVR